MAFRLVFDDDISLPLPFDGHVEDLLTSLIQRVEPGSPGEAELSRRCVDALSALIESNVVPPTEKQIKYAVAIARELSLQLSPDVLQFRDAMQAFLSAHASTYRRRKGSLLDERR